MSVNERIQVSNATEFNRYPKIFGLLASILENYHTSEHILSFGCSTGDELKSLDVLYLRGHHLTGVDISESALSQAKSSTLPRNNQVEYFNSKDNGWRVPNRYRAVLALSVLCRWPETQKIENINSIYSFQDFEKQILELSALVKNGGYLIIHNSNFYFEDTDIFTQYRIAPLNVHDIGFVTRFDIKGNVYKNERPQFTFYEKL